MNRVSIVVGFLFLASGSATGQESLVNFSHLRHLTERIAFDGDSVSVVHVYANYPDYHWTDAKESGPEGIACVDDAARAAVLYLRHFETTGDGRSLAAAKDLLAFVLKMQADDGEFYNFIRADRSVNRDGETSRKSFGWWAARGVWSMGIGYRILRDRDPKFAGRLRTGIDRAIPHVTTILQRYGEMDSIGSYRVPRWLLYESAADATSELALGLIESFSATEHAGVKKAIEQLGDGFVVMQDGDASGFPYGMHRSWRTMWHMWGNSQSSVLASAGRLFRNARFLRSAEREAVGFYSRLLIQGYRKEIDVAAPEDQKTFEQIAYCVRPMTLALIGLYEATKKPKYLIMAGLSASWLFGNNAAGVPMYDPVTGRCFDGIQDSTTVNKNAGAESTIEALMTLVELERFPRAVRVARYRITGRGETGDLLYGFFNASGEEEIALALDIKTSTLRVMEGKESALFRESLR
ncbi:MAG: hypothetical protein AB1428_02830 [Bacteroidota bacterium]